jgi:4-aminobutyrate aminotransferase-like enzyme/Ser/Thr protein kinase RdoA (MazF antagonist)
VPGVAGGEAIDARVAEHVARDLYGLDGRATPLESELDRNFRLRLADGTSFALKLHRPERELALEDCVLGHLAAQPDAPAAPRLVRTLAGEPSGTVVLAGREHVVRLLSWLDGRTWAQAGPSAARLEQLGAVVAGTDRALATLDCPGMRRTLLWNLHEAPAVARFTELADPARQSLLERVFERFERHVAPRLDALPQQLIHNDANEHNIVVGDDGAVAGLIDFGDVAWSARVCGLAVACAYAMQRHADPVPAVVPVVRGYHVAAALRPEELAVLFDLVRTRLAMSVCMAAWQHREDPGNDYLLVSQRGVTELLDRLAGEDPDLAHARFRDACGYQPSPVALHVRRHLQAAAPGLVLDADRIGRYLEERSPRSVHLGTDLFGAAGAAVHAPLDGVIEAAAGVLAVRHTTGDGVPFWTLYGQLDPGSTAAPGDAVRRGERLGVLGGGATPPHLHLQLVAGPVARPTEVPGEVARAEVDVWRSLCPDPNLLLRLPGGAAARVERDAEALAARRRTRMSRALSTAYREPLHIVRGAGAHLYDSSGRAWLDLVNNVCHVGHCHPRVVAAAQRQIETLNTNTRYLHESALEYAGRLAATLPDPLSVCFLVNSGSEANDLALRLARAHTGSDHVLVVDHAYHGHLSSLIAISPYKFDGPGGRGAPDTTHVCPQPDPYRGVLRGTDPGRVYADAVGERIDELAARGLRPAAFFAESLQGCGGQIAYPPGYLTHAFALVRAAGGVCVADEVQVGLGRVGERFWGFELGDVVPDIVTMGKPLGNGHPLAAVVTTPEIAASFATGMEYFNTFGGNPVSCEVGLAVLDVVADEGLQRRASERGAQLLAGLGELAQRHPLIGDVRGHGLFLGVELSADRDTREPATADAARVKEALKQRGVLISTDGPDDNVLKIKPPLVLSADDCDHFLEALDEAL